MRAGGPHDRRMLKLVTLFAFAGVLAYPQTAVKKKSSTTEVASKAASADHDKEIKLGVDEPGCKDSALLPRLPGCSIIQCDSKQDAENVRIQTAPSADGAPQEELLDGASEVIYYMCPSKTTVLSIAKQMESALTKGGYHLVFNGRDGEDFPLLSAQKGDQWIQVSTYIYNELSAYVQTAIKAAPEPATSADAIFEEFVRTGRVALPGLSFDGEKLTGESDKILTEVAVFLVREGNLKVRLEGHTDNQGDKRANMELSQRRASAVAVWLIEHGVETGRVSFQGYGDTKPAADNATEEGRSRNRRIELTRL